MRHLLLVTLALLTALTFSATAVAAKKKSAGKLRHVVSLKFKDTAKPDEIKKVVDAFAALKTQIPQVDKFEWGQNVSPEKHDRGHTHVFFLTFKSEKDRDDYIVHPDHKAFGALLGPIMADVFVVDYWARD
jgi:hypothetical protein